MVLAGDEGRGMRGEGARCRGHGSRPKPGLEGLWTAGGWGLPRPRSGRSSVRRWPRIPSPMENTLTGFLGFSIFHQGPGIPLTTTHPARSSVLHPQPPNPPGEVGGGVASSHLVRGTLTLPQLAHSRTLDLSRALLINAMKGLWGQLRQRVSECLSGGCVHLGEVRFSEALGGTPTQSRTRPREPGSLLRESPSWESARPVPLRAPVGSPDSRLQAVPAPAARLSPSPRPPPHTATGCLQRGLGPGDTGCCSRVAPGPVCRGPARVAMGTAPRSAEPGVDVGASPGASAPSCSLCLVFCVKLPSSVRACFIPTLSTVDRCVNSCI